MLNSSRQRDAHKFYGCLLTSIYECQNYGQLFLFCGDFSSRCGAMVDFIEGIDDLSQQYVIDFSVNRYGHLLIECLLNSNMCILNGRNYTSNDFTFVT